MTKSKLEKVLEHMVNSEMSLANDLLHEHLIEAAREIYAEIAEEDDLAEAELELDEDEDLDEGYRDADRSGDFEDDISTMEDEIEAEEYFGENGDDDEDEAFDDLEGEMGGDELDGEFGGDELDGGEFDGGDELDGEVAPEGDIENAMVNVEDAMDELKAVFAELVGDTGVEDDMGDEVADELGGDEIEFGGDEDELGDEDEVEESSRFFEDEDLDEDADEDLDESAKLKTQSVTMAGDDDSKKSPIKQNTPNISDKGKAVNFAGGADEKGGKGETPKKMTITDPQDNGGKFNKAVKKPSNKSEKAKSNIGS